jgi:predicted MFS family arabinose efflux permease
MSISSTATAASKERWLLLTLAGIQFTHIVDFMVMMPLGPALTQLFHISARDFGFLVSAYTIAAGISGLSAAFYMDRFDRKSLTLFLYGGFALSTLSCAFAPSFEWLLVARTLAGLFGGVLAAMTQTIVGEMIPYERRGRAMGIVMSSFSLSTVAGVPLSLFLAHHLSWHAPFVAIAVLSGVLMLVAALTLPRMHSHLAEARAMSPWGVIVEVLKQANHWRAFAFMALMTMATFTVIPYITLYMTGNVGLTMEQVPVMYLFGGVASFFSARWIGRKADQYGKARMFRWVSVGAMAALLALTQLPPMPFVGVVVFMMAFFIVVPGRMVPGMALITGAADPRLRGAFMSLSSSVQQFSSGLATLIGGLFISHGDKGALLGYGWAGLAAAVAAALTMLMVGRVAVHQDQRNA